MLVIGDALDALFLGSFLFGLLFSACSHLLGVAHIGVHLPKSFPGHGGHSASPGGHAGNHRALPGKAVAGLLNLPSILAFVSWFGGVGYQARHALGFVTPASLACGVLGGTCAAAFVWWFLAKVILPQDRALDPEAYQLPGTAARVSSSIRPGGTGEIVYEQAGVRQVSAARAGNGVGVARGTSVVIIRHERGVAMVAAAQVPAAEPGAVTGGGSPTGSGGETSDVRLAT